MKLKATTVLCIAATAATLAIAGRCVLGDEEFVGPLAGWKNVKADYGAVGDGKADDTAAIQRAFDDLRLHKDSCVLYFPAGTYRITDTVKTVRKAHHECMGVTIIGEDPATTVAPLGRQGGGMMVQYDAWYSQDRPADARRGGPGRRGPGLWRRLLHLQRDLRHGLPGRRRRHVDGHRRQRPGRERGAPLPFRRCGRGLQTNNFNSMDIWAWYCRFEDCDYGLYNGAGNFHAYQCLFLRSKKADIGTANLMVFSFVGNTSIGSQCFLDFAGGHSWGSPTSITGNRIIEPTRATSPSAWATAGRTCWRTTSSGAGREARQPAVVMTWGDQTLAGNTYTVAEPVKEAGRFTRLAEKIVAAETIATSPSSIRDLGMLGLSFTPPKRNRKVFELPASADAAAIQQAIDEAAKLTGQRPGSPSAKGKLQDRPHARHSRRVRRADRRRRRRRDGHRPALERRAERPDLPAPRPQPRDRSAIFPSRPAASPASSSRTAISRAAASSATS